MSCLLEYVPKKFSLEPHLNIGILIITRTENIHGNVRVVYYEWFTKAKGKILKKDYEWAFSRKGINMVYKSLRLFIVYWNRAYCYYLRFCLYYKVSPTIKFAPKRKKCPLNATTKIWISMKRAAKAFIAYIFIFQIKVNLFRIFFLFRYSVNTFKLTIIHMYVCAFRFKWDLCEENRRQIPALDAIDNSQISINLSLQRNINLKK